MIFGSKTVSEAKPLSRCPALSRYLGMGMFYRGFSPVQHNYGKTL